MITIPSVQIQLPDGSEAVQPAYPPPDGYIASSFDGTQYTVYEAGDTLPETLQ